MKFTFSMGSTIERDKAKKTSEYRSKSRLEESTSFSKNLAYERSSKFIKNQPYEVIEENYKSKPRYHRYASYLLF